jgi:hypothetical protein
LYPEWEPLSLFHLFPINPPLHDLLQLLAEAVQTNRKLIKRLVFVLPFQVPYLAQGVIVQSVPDVIVPFLNGC